MTPSGARVLVIGAGIIGRATAYFLSRQGVEVVLLDAHEDPALTGTCGSPTSRASLGVLSHPNGSDSPYAQLYRDGHALHARLATELAAETGLDVGWRPLGGIELFADEAQLEEVWRLNRERGCPVERLDERGLREREPALAVGTGGLYFSGDHRVDPLKLGEVLLVAAQQRGAITHWGEGVVRIVQRDGSVEVETNRGIHCGDFAVLAAGAWTGALAGLLGAEVQVRPVRGQQARFAGSPLGHLVRVDGRYMIPDGDETVVGATVEEVGFALETTAEAAANFSAWVGEMLERRLPLIGQRAGLRPKPKSGRPLIGPLQDAPQVFVASGHYKNGVLLGPITGQIVARWIVEGAPDRDMSGFAPER
jgi:glycine oxidase